MRLARPFHRGASKRREALMSTQLALVTGANRGLGYGIAQKLAKKGFRVVITSREKARADEAAEKIKAAVPGADVKGAALDLASLASVRSFAETFASQEPVLDLLVNNAGIMMQEKARKLSPEGHEITFATNHLGHFLLTNMLLPNLKAAPEARVVVVASRLHLPKSMGTEVNFNFDDINQNDGYDPMRAYKNSKLANVWFAKELQRRLSGSSVTANAVCPGFVPETIAEQTRGMQRFMMKYIMPLLPMAHTVDEATDTFLKVATDPALKGKGGEFYGEMKVIDSSPESQDAGKAKRLWELSEKLTAAS
jgi:retinol dehydrogenase 12